MDSIFKFYNKDNYQELFADDPESLVAQLLEQQSKNLISNVKTEVVAFAAGGEVWPVTVNQAEYGNALICSPYATYVTYGLDELDKFGKRWIRALVVFNAVIMGVITRLTKFNKVIQVNNNLNSLLKYSDTLNSYLPALTKMLCKKYPKHAIVFFRVNDVLDQSMLNNLRESGYLVFPDRLAHVFFPESNFIRRSHTKRDLSLLSRSSYSILKHDDISLSDAARFAELYRMLFIEKHSHLNPVYTEQYFREAIRHRWHEYVALRNPQGRIDAFISWFKKDKIMVCGPLGYDINADRKIGLYRQLVAICLQHASEHNLPFNMGGGSDEFKSKRGSTETAEYTAVYCRHLPFYRHLPWKILSFACSKLLKKIVHCSHL